jgi:hypothetical protein
MARPIPITYGMIILSLGAVAGLYAMVDKLKPARIVSGSETQSAPASKAPPPLPQPMLTAASASGPIVLRDRDSIPAWKRLRDRAAELKTAIDGLAEAKQAPDDLLEPLCKKVKDDVVTLAGETNPEVARTVNAARRGCDLDRHVALAQLGVRLLANDKTPASKKERCIWIGAQTKALMDGGFGDEPEVKPLMSDVGARCAI